MNIKSKNSPTNEKGSPSFITHHHNITGLLPMYNRSPGFSIPSHPVYTLPPPTIYTNTPKSKSKSNANDVSTSPTTTTTSSTVHEMPSITNEIANENATNTADSNSMNGTNSTSDAIFPRPTLKTVLPIAIIVCGIIIASALIVSSFLFRKRLCAIGKSLKKKSKEEMAKKSNQSNPSFSTNPVMMSSMSEDSRNSMVMQHWNGTKAFNNRYVPWERENSHMQVNTKLTHFNAKDRKIDFTL